MSNRFGLMNTQPYQSGINMPSNNGGYTQIHFHGPNQTIITSGHIKMPNGQYGQTFNGYESCMLDLVADLRGWKKF